ncbi:MAG: 6-phosphofructokinase [Gammaproteobacteria bacterium]|nr:6-phosphofructokinase [Gammaproteobacteria bacterium]
MKRILILTSGGDAPGMNAAIRAVVRTASFFNIEVLACHNGFQGLIREEIFSMKAENVGGIIQRGGTILQSSRSKQFHQKKFRNKCRAFLKEQNIDGLIVIGGDGSFKGMATLEQEGGPKSIGIPGTIDNDIIGTEYTIGFDTARNTALNAIDHIRDTAFSNHYYFLVEVMGQKSGFLASDVGIAGGAEYILTPEFPISIVRLAKKINKPSRHKESLIIVVAEAGKPGRSLQLAEQLKKRTPFAYRACILGHIQRGGTPTVLDRKLASEMGHLAVTALKNGASKQMTAICNNQLCLVDLPKVRCGYRKLSNKKVLEISNILAS